MNSKIKENNSHFAAKDKLVPMNKKSEKITDLISVMDSNDDDKKRYVLDRLNQNIR